MQPKKKNKKNARSQMWAKLIRPSTVWFMFIYRERNSPIDAGKQGCLDYPLERKLGAAPALVSYFIWTDDQQEMKEWHHYVGTYRPLSLNFLPSGDSKQLPMTTSVACFLLLYFIALTYTNNRILGKKLPLKVTPPMLMMDVLPGQMYFSSVVYFSNSAFF